jgi:hypothetical protein
MRQEASAGRDETVWDGDAYLVVMILEAELRGR